MLAAPPPAPSPAPLPAPTTSTSAAPPAPPPRCDPPPTQRFSADAVLLLAPSPSSPPQQQPEPLVAAAPVAAPALADSIRSTIPGEAPPKRPARRIRSSRLHDADTAAQPAAEAAPQPAPPPPAPPPKPAEQVEAVAQVGPRESPPSSPPQQCTPPPTPSAVACAHAPGPSVPAAPNYSVGAPAILATSASAPQLGAVAPAPSPRQPTPKMVAPPSRRQRPRPLPSQLPTVEQDRAPPDARLSRLYRSKTEDRSHRRVVLHSGGIPPASCWLQPQPPPEVHPTLGVCDVTGWVGRTVHQDHSRASNRTAASTPAMGMHRHAVAHGRPPAAVKSQMVSHLESSGLLTPITPKHLYETAPGRVKSDALAEPPAWGHVRSLLLPSAARPPSRSLFTGPHPQTPGYAPRDRAQGGGWGVEVVPVVLPRKSTGSSFARGSLLPSIARRPESHAESVWVPSLGECGC